MVCADTDDEAERLAATVDLNFALRAKGERPPLASPEDALAYDYTPVDRARIAQNRTKLSVGSPETVMAQAEAVDRGDPGRRGHGHDHDLRSRGAQAFL